MSFETIATPSAAATPALEISEVRKSYAATPALAGLSFGVAQGQICGLLGPNGAGKSTLMRCITTLLRQDAGTIRCFGHDTLREPRAARGTMGYVAQQVALDKVLTGREHLQLQGALYHVPRRDLAGAIDRVLRLVGLEEVADRRVSTYSGGMARRLDLSAALLHRPALLILDEPTVGLDIHTRSAIWEFVRRLASEGTAVLIASHHIEEVEYLSDRIVIVDHGRVIAQGTSDELKGDFGKWTVHLKTKEYVSVEELHMQAEVMRLNPEAAKVLADPSEGGRLLVTLRDGGVAPGDVRRSLAATLGIEADRLFLFSLERPSLDDVFLEATGRTLRDAPWAGEDPAPARARRQ